MASNQIQQSNYLSQNYQGQAPYQSNYNQGSLSVSDYRGGQPNAYNTQPYSQSGLRNSVQPNKNKKIFDDNQSRLSHQSGSQTYQQNRYNASPTPQLQGNNAGQNNNLYPNQNLNNSGIQRSAIFVDNYQAPSQNYNSVQVSNVQNNNPNYQPSLSYQPEPKQQNQQSFQQQKAYDEEKRLKELQLQYEQEQQLVRKQQEQYDKPVQYPRDTQPPNTYQPNPSGTGAIEPYYLYGQEIKSKFEGPIDEQIKRANQKQAGVSLTHVQQPNVPAKTTYEIDQKQELDIYLFSYQNQEVDDNYYPQIQQLQKQSENASICSIF